MKILHIADLNMSLTAGPTYSVPSYVNAQNMLEGITSNLFITTHVNKQNEKFYYKESFENKSNYRKFITSHSLIIFHSTYILEFVKISKIINKHNIPYIIVPRGGFNSGAKKVKKYKKKIGDLLIFNKFFRNAYAIQFLTEKEKENSVYRTPNDFVLSNGIEIPDFKVERSNKGSTNIVYIGSIDTYIKGLDTLIEAVHLIKKELKEYKVTIDLYGPDIRKSKEYLLQLIQKYELENILNIKQPVFSKEKQRILLNSHIFIQTSRFEGLPMGILEALSFGLPCILTPGTNLSEEVRDNYAGIEVAEDPLSISKGIMQLVKNKDDYHILSNNAVKLAEKYSWNKIALNSIKQYQEIINQTNRDN